MKIKRDLTIIDVYSREDLEAKVEELKEEGKYIIFRWGDQPTTELLNKDISDDRISKHAIETLMDIIKERPDLVRRILDGEIKQ